MRDLDLIGSTDGTVIWPEDVPGFMARSSLDDDARATILAACTSAFMDDTSVGQSGGSKGKGTGRPKADRPSAASVAIPGVGTPGSEAPRTATTRRSKRTAGRHT